MPFVYRIEKVGVSNLKKHNQESAQYIQAGQSHAKNESKKHALMISNFLSLAESSIRQHANRTFINERQIKQQQFGTPKQITWPVTMNLKGMSITLRTVPDAVFGIVNETKSTAEYFFLEADRGTMPIDPTTWDRSSLAKKVAAYHASYQHQLYAQHLGLKGVRVIFFVPTRTRLLSLISLCSQCPNGRGLFLAVDLETIQAHDSLFDIPFISGSGKLRYIV